MTKSIVQRTKSLIDYGQYRSLRKVATLNNVSKSAVSLWVREAYGLYIRKKKVKTRVHNQLHLYFIIARKRGLYYSISVLYIARAREKKYSVHY